MVKYLIIKDSLKGENIADVRRGLVETLSSKLGEPTGKVFRHQEGNVTVYDVKNDGKNTFYFDVNAPDNLAAVVEKSISLPHGYRLKKE